MSYNYELYNPPATELYAAHIKDEEIRKKSSSGGIFTAIAEYVIENNGYVCGAAFDEKKYLRHIIINDKESLAKFRGSKYVISNVSQIFPEVKSLLSQGKLVLFCSIPCQVFSLKKFLGQKYDNLIIVDLLCHGVVDQDIFHYYLASQERKNKQKVEGVDFRNTDNGEWEDFSMKLTFSEKITQNTKRMRDTFMRPFLRNQSTQPACSKCKFRTIARCGDITLGDFWGVDEKFNDKKGVSFVLISTETGRKVWNGLRDKLGLCEKIPLTKEIQHWNVEFPRKGFNKDKYYEFKSRLLKEDYDSVVEDLFPYYQTKYEYFKEMSKINYEISVNLLVF